MKTARSFPASGLLPLLGVLLLAALRLTAAAPTNAAGFFGLTNIWEFHLALTLEDWKAMEPSAARGAPGGPAQTEYPYVRASLRWNGQTLNEIGLRFKGNSSFRGAGNGYKCPFKLDFNHYRPGQKFLGLVQLNLSNNFKDPSQCREALAYQVFRAAGVPCPRTAWIKLYLTLPGKLNDEYIGLYTAVEDVGKSFLQDHFGRAGGMLLKPERFRGFPYLGSGWSDYQACLDPKGELTVAEKERFVGLAALIHRASDDDFRARIGQLLPVDPFLRFLAANTALANLDSFLGSGHNYYLYLVPQTNQFAFIPWDLNEAFGVFQQQQGDLSRLSIAHPHAGENRLIERILAIPDFDRAYRQHLARLAAGPLSAGTVDVELNLIASACQGAIAEELRSGFPLRSGPGMGRGDQGAASLRQFCARRVESITAQLAGQPGGLVPEMRMGPFRPGPAPR